MQIRPGLFRKILLDRTVVEFPMTISSIPIPIIFQAHPLNPDKTMPRKRFIVPWTGSEEKLALYHCVSYSIGGAE